MGFLLLSPQIPAATGSGIHISQPRIFQPWWRSEAIKTSLPWVFKSVSFLSPSSSSFCSFSVNNIHFCRGSKNTIVARRSDGEREKSRGESIDLHAYIVMDKTELLLFSFPFCFEKTLGSGANPPLHPSSPPIYMFAAILPKCILMPNEG